MDIKDIKICRYVDQRFRPANSKVQELLYEKLQEENQIEELLKQSIYQGNILITLAEFPWLFLSIIPFLCKTKVDDATTLTLYHILSTFQLHVDELKNEKNEHLLKLQPAYTSLLYYYILKYPESYKDSQSILDYFLEAKISDLTNEIERINAICFNKPPHHKLAIRSRNPLLYSTSQQDLIMLDYPSKLQFQSENLIPVLDRLEYLRKHATLYFQYVAIPIYEDWINAICNTIHKRFIEIDCKTITRLRDIYPLSIPLVPRVWKTDLVRNITTLSLPYLSAVLGIEQREIAEGRHFRQLQMIDTQGIEAYVKEYTTWHKQKILNDSFGNYEIYNECDVLGRNCFDLPVEDLFIVKNQTHIYLFAKEEEWEKLLECEKNFHTNEPLSIYDLEALRAQKSRHDRTKSIINHKMTSTVPENLKNVHILKCLDMYQKHIQLLDIEEKNRFEQDKEKFENSRKRGKKRSTLKRQHSSSTNIEREILLESLLDPQHPYRNHTESQEEE